MYTSVMVYLASLDDIGAGATKVDTFAQRCSPENVSGFEPMFFCWDAGDISLEHKGLVKTRAGIHIIRNSLQQRQVRQTKKKCLQ